MVIIVWKDFCESVKKAVKVLIVGNVNSIFQTNLSSQLRRWKASSSSPPRLPVEPPRIEESCLRPYLQ